MKLISALVLTFCIAMALAARSTVAQPCVRADGDYCLTVEADGCSDFYLTLKKDQKVVGKEQHVRLNTGQQPDQCVSISDTCTGCTNLAVFEEQAGLALCMRTNIDCGLVKLNYENCTTVPNCANLDCSKTACQGHGTCDVSTAPPKCQCEPKDGVTYSGLTCGIGTFTMEDGHSCVTTPFTEEKPLCSIIEVENCKAVRAEITYGEYRFGPLDFDLDSLENRPETVKEQCVKINFLDQCNVCLKPHHVTLEKGKFRYCSTMHFNCYGFTVPDVDMGCVERDLVQDCQNINNCPDGCVHGKCVKDVCQCEPGYYKSDCSYFKNETCLIIPDFDGNALCLSADQDCKTRELSTTVMYGGNVIDSTKESVRDLTDQIITANLEVATDCTVFRDIARADGSKVCINMRVVCPDGSNELDLCVKSCSHTIVYFFWAVLIIIPLALLMAFGVLVYRRFKRKNNPHDNGFSLLSDMNNESGSDYGGEDDDGL